LPFKADRHSVNHKGKIHISKRGRKGIKKFSGLEWKAASPMTSRMGKHIFLGILAV
jgi:hypothetical protein